MSDGVSTSAQEAAVAGDTDSGQPPRSSHTRSQWARVKQSDLGKGLGRCFVKNNALILMCVDVYARLPT